MLTSDEITKTITLWTDCFKNELYSVLDIRKNESEYATATIIVNECEWDDGESEKSYTWEVYFGEFKISKGARYYSDLDMVKYHCIEQLSRIFKSLKINESGKLEIEEKI